MSLSRKDQSREEMEWHLGVLQRAIVVEKEAHLKRTDAEANFKSLLDALLDERETLTKEIHNLRGQLCNMATSDPAECERLASHAHELASAGDLRCTFGVTWDLLIPEHRESWIEFVQKFLVAASASHSAEVKP